MSLTAEQRIAELSPSRLAINLFVDCFESDATLRSSPVFWKSAVTYVADAYFETGVFDQLLRAVPFEQLSPYVPELANRLANADALEITIKSVSRRIQDGSIKIDPKSLVGSLCCDQAVLLDTLDIYGAIAVWRNLVRLFIPFAQKLGQNVPKETLCLLEPRSTMERVPGETLEPMWCLEHRDVEGTLRNFHRSLDLNGGPNSALQNGGHLNGGQHDHINGTQFFGGHFGAFGGASTGTAPPKSDQRDVPNQQAKTQELAIIYESFGYISAALEALSQAFASQRRRLIADNKDGNSFSDSHGSLVETRGMVSWLHHVLAFHDRIAQIPPEMNLRLEQIQDYLRKTAPTLDEKAEVFSIDMNEALDSGGSPEFLLSTSMDMIDLYPSHWQAHNTLVKNCTFHLLLSIMWFRLGKQHASHSHIKQALSAASNCDIPSLKTHLLSEISFAIGFEFGNPIESIMALQDATSKERFDEGAQHVRTLLFADLHIQAHNFEAARNLLEELEDLSLNKFELRTKNALQVKLYRYMGEYYIAYVHAGQCVSNLSEEEQKGYWSVFFRLAGVRALVQSQDPLNAIEARCWISECLRVSKEFDYANLALEAALLEARLFYNDGDYHSCHILCQTLEQNVSTTPQCWLKCEWQLLYAASTQLMTGEVLNVDPVNFRKTLYTEFGDFTSLPRLAAICLRPRIAMGARDLTLPENPISAVLNDLLDGRLKYSDFPQAIMRSYETFVELQNRVQPRDETPVMDTAVTEFSVERMSYVAPSVEDVSLTSTPPPPDIKLVPPKSASPSSQVDEDISVSKRLRPMSGSPRKGRKRRSVKLD